MTVLADFRGAEPYYEDESQLVALRLTPAEWRRILADPTFLGDAGNEYSAPRRYHGLPVQIVPQGWRG
jgi:hypothetical protein